MTIEVEIDTPDYSGNWRTFTLYSQGDTLQSLIDDAYISETDQDGGELSNSPLEEYGNRSIQICHDIIKEKWKQRTTLGKVLYKNQGN